jgi:hypothetical protein
MKMMCFIVAMLFLAQLASSSPAENDVLILEPGLFHADEVPDVTGFQFTGLFLQDGKYLLAPAAVNVEPAMDPIVDEENGKMTGHDVKISGPGEAVFALKGNPFARLGEVVALSSAPTNDLIENPRTLQFMNSTYTLATTNAAPADQGYMGAQLMLTADGVAQMLYQLPENPDMPSWSLLWAGDLDGDSKLDLYLDVSHHYNVSEKRLFLSSLAKPGQLVGELGKLRTVGC